MAARRDRVPDGRESIASSKGIGVEHYGKVILMNGGKQLHSRILHMRPHISGRMIVRAGLP